ncbi:MAG: nuclear transport factor 2 family protein [Acidimicrobiales bacterium]
MPTTASVQADVLRHLLTAAVAGDRESMADLVTDDVVAWSPNLYVTSRDELLAALERRDDTFSRIDVQVRALDQVGDKAIAEWHVAVDHTGPLVVDDDLAIEPTGRRLHVSGATVAEFDGDRICAFRSYFDDLALVEQALAEE